MRRLINLFYDYNNQKLKLVPKLLVFVLLWQVIAIIILRASTPLLANNEFILSSFLNVVMAFSVLGSSWIYLRYVEKKSWGFFGLGLKKAVLLGIVKGCLYAFLAFTVVLIGLFLFTKMETDLTMHSALVDYSFTVGFLGQCSRYVGGSLFEEVIATAFLTTFLIQVFNHFNMVMTKATIGAVLLSAVFFGLIHGMSPNASVLSTFNLCVFGLFTSMSFVMSKNLGFAIGFHMLWNIIQNNILGLPNSGQDAVLTIFKISFYETDSILTGGDFGLEGGLIASIALTVCMAIYLMPMDPNKIKRKLEQPYWTR